MEDTLEQPETSGHPCANALYGIAVAVFLPRAIIGMLG